MADILILPTSAIYFGLIIWLYNDYITKNSLYLSCHYSKKVNT